MNSDKKTHYAVLINGHETITNGVYLKKQEDNGGAKRDRTADLLRARQALSQLSYGPIVFAKPTSCINFRKTRKIPQRIITLYEKCFNTASQEFGGSGQT